MSQTIKCPRCGKLVSVRFPIHDCKKKATTEEKSLWLLPVADHHALRAMGYSDAEVDEIMPRDEPEDFRPADWTERTV